MSALNISGESFEAGDLIMERVQLKVVGDLPSFFSSEWFEGRFLLRR